MRHPALPAACRRLSPPGFTRRVKTARQRSSTMVARDTTGRVPGLLVRAPVLLAVCCLCRAPRSGASALTPPVVTFEPSSDCAPGAARDDLRANSEPAPPSNANPAWSPDGRTLAFESSRDGNDEIYVMNADGSNRHRLTRDSRGLRACMVAGRKDDHLLPAPAAAPGQLDTINADGSDQQLARRTRSGQRFDPVWSPDGRRSRTRARLPLHWHPHDERRRQRPAPAHLHLRRRARVVAGRQAGSPSTATNRSTW